MDYSNLGLPRQNDLKFELSDFRLRLLYRFMKRSLWLGFILFSHSHYIELRLIYDKLDKMFYGN